MAGVSSSTSPENVWTHKDLTATRRQILKTRKHNETMVSVDYLVVGAGASGMAFVDTLLAHSPEPVSVLMIDKRTRPGGHWNDAY